MKTIETIETILKETEDNIKRREARIRRLFFKKLKNPKLLWLLYDTEFLWDLVVQFFETKGIYTINTTWLHGRLVNEITKRNRLKRKGTLLQITTEELEMFEESGYDPIELLEQYDYISKTYGENYAKYLVSGEYDLEDLQKAEGISRATLFRRLQKMRTNNEQ
jgi:hypothetical protein